MVLAGQIMQFCRSDRAGSRERREVWDEFLIPGAQDDEETDPFRLCGTSQLVTASILAGSMPTPASNTTWSRKCTFRCSYWHFDTISFNLAICNRSRKLSTLSRCDTKFTEWMMMSSR